MTDEKLIEKCTKYVDYYILKVSHKFAFDMETRNDFIFMSCVECKKSLDKIRESVIKKGKSKNENYTPSSKLNDILIKVFVKRTMF